jgi:hypothetical protein
MTVTNTFKQTPPRRPTVADLHAGLVIDDPEFPPDPGDPNADAMNQSDELVVSACNMIDAGKLYVAFPSGTTTKTGIWSPRDDLALSDFTLVDNGTGDTSITHTGGKLPAATWPPTAKVVGNGGDTTINVESIANGWRVRTRTGGTLADVPFLLEFSGLG